MVKTNVKSGEVRHLQINPETGIEEEVVPQTPVPTENDGTGNVENTPQSTRKGKPNHQSSSPVGALTQAERGINTAIKLKPELKEVLEPILAVIVEKRDSLKTIVSKTKPIDQMTPEEKQKTLAKLLKEEENRKKKIAQLMGS